MPDALLGRVFANLYGAVGASAALSYVGGGLLLDATDAPTTLIVAGTGGVSALPLLTAAALRPARRLRTSTLPLLASPLANG